MTTGDLERAARQAAGLLLTGAFVWGLSLPLLPVALATTDAGGPARRLTTTAYAAAGLVCHQRPDRSFSSAGVPWAVCGRCAGLYAGAAVGAVLALGRWRGASSLAAPVWRRMFGAAAAPTLVLWICEYLLGWRVSNVVRALGAVPLGVMAAGALGGVARGYLR